MSYAFRVPALLGSVGVALLFLSQSQADPKQASYWQVDDVRPGMKGQGRTVMKGTKIESFDAEVIGVLKNTTPGRDMILCRLAGLNLEKTGIIAGMSGSPIYINGKLLGAVAFAWPFGTEPIAGVTPFAQMHEYVASYERRDMAERQSPKRIGLAVPLHIDGKDFDTVTVSDHHDPLATAADGLWMVPIRTPLAASGMSTGSLKLLGSLFKDMGMVPMQAGGAAAGVIEKEKDLPLLPGSALTVAMIQGDFDLSGIGTVTHVEGKRVYGWGHPFFGAGACEFPLMTGYVHTIIGRRSISFKMGSPIRNVGVINADVSTCIAGWLERTPDLLPVRTTVTRLPQSKPKTFNVRIVRQRNMVASLVFTALSNSVDMEGDLPEELTAHVKARIELEGLPEVRIDDTFSGNGISGSRAPQALYSSISNIINLLNLNPYKPVRIKNIECATEIQPGRRTADIESVELEENTYSPGETLRAVVYLRPYKGIRQRVSLALPLPADLAEGNYTATIADDLSHARHELRDDPNLSNPQDLDHLLRSLKLQTGVKRTHLVLRVPLFGTGVALSGQSLPDLPPGVVQVLGSRRKTGVQTTNSALVARRPTDWVIQGSESIRFHVEKTRRFQNR